MVSDEEAKRTIEKLRKLALEDRPWDSPGAESAPRQPRADNSIRALWKRAFSNKPKNDWLLPMKYVPIEMRPREIQPRLF